MQELIDAIRHHSPRTARSLIAATEADVAAVETALGRPLPAVYRGFLRTAGRGLGLFRPFDGRYDFSVDAVRAGAAEAPSPRYLFIAADESGLDMNLYLDLDQPSDDPPVVAILRGGGSFDRKDDSFRRFLLTEVFVALRLPLLVWQTRFLAGPGGAPSPAEIEAFVRERRMPPVPHTGSWHPCYDRGDMAIEIRRPPKGGFLLVAAAAEEAWLDRLQSTLEERFGLQSLG